MTRDVLRRDPGRWLPTLREDFEQLLGDWLDLPEQTETASRSWRPRYDLEDTDDAYVLHVELPGVEPEDIDVTVQDTTLTVKGERQFYEQRSEERFARRERSFGAFLRVVQLPDTVDEQAVQATHHNGVLTVTVPKTAETRARRITVTAD